MILFDLVFILIISYMLILYKKMITPDVGADRYPFSSILLCKEKKLYAPFKYRPLGFWLARIFQVGCSKINKLVLWAERYYHNVYVENNKEIDRYYVFQYFLLLFANLSFYWYLSILNLPILIGVLLLDFFICLTFFHDAFDNFLEIGFFALFLGSILSGINPIFLFTIALLASLNRETSIFMVLISLFYSNFLGILFVSMGSLIGFIIPRILYRKSVDQYDSMYCSGFRFLTFDPIKNWTRSIWPHLKKRFIGIQGEFFMEYQGSKLVPYFNQKPFITNFKDIYFNKIFLGIGIIILFFISFILCWNIVPLYFHNLIRIFSLFIILISIPGDIREIRIYSPAFCILIPCLLCLL